MIASKDPKPEAPPKAKGYQCKPIAQHIHRQKAPGSLQHAQGKQARIHIYIPEPAQAIQDLAEHEKTRPDHIKATHPNAPNALRKAWEKWRDDHLHLRCLLTMAEKAEHAGWKPLKGNE